jgi:hypothetical protein
MTIGINLKEDDDEEITSGIGIGSSLREENIGEFAAPSGIEIKIVNYCIEILNLSIGNFWYKWFKSNKEGNYTIHIDTSDPSLEEIIQKTFPKVDFVKSVFKVQKLNITGDIDGFKFQYFIYFKGNPFYWL